MHVPLLAIKHCQVKSPNKWILIKQTDRILWNLTEKTSGFPVFLHRNWKKNGIMDTVQASGIPWVKLQWKERVLPLLLDFIFKNYLPVIPMVLFWMWEEGKGSCQITYQQNKKPGTQLLILHIHHWNYFSFEYYHSPTLSLPILLTNHESPQLPLGIRPSTFPKRESKWVGPDVLTSSLSSHQQNISKWTKPTLVNSILYCSGQDLLLPNPTLTFLWP